MLHQIKCLTAIQLCNLCGLNVVRYGRDTKKRIRFIGMGVLYILLMVLLWMYLGMFTIGMIRLGVEKVVPFYLYMMVSLVILCFSFFKAASVILLAVLQKYFVAICSSLNATIAKKNYKMGNLNTSSVLKALWKRELRRYFASSIYVLNTMIGYVLLVMAAVAFWIIGEEKMLQMLGLPFQIELIPILPFALTLIGNMMPMAACSISMEGKQWWIAKTLPITMKQILDGKIAANLSIALPFFAVAEVFVVLAVRSTLSEGIWLILIPLVYTMFLSVAGLSINLAVPLMEWESEVRVVKQSASMMLELLLGFVSALIPIGLILLKKADETFVNLGTVAVLVILTAVLYKRNQNVVL